MGNDTNRTNKASPIASLTGHTCPKCVLVAEDDPDDRFMLRRAWKKANLPHRLVDLADGEQVIRYLSGSPPFEDRKLYPVPDLLLLDLKMPKLNGFDVLTWVQGRPELRRLNVLVFSSSSLESDRQFAVKLGAKAFLTKPNESSQLVALVSLLHEYWLANPGALQTSGTEILTLSGLQSIP